jgi:hypothetical protein
VFSIALGDVDREVDHRVAGNWPGAIVDGTVARPRRSSETAQVRCTKGDGAGVASTAPSGSGELCPSKFWLQQMPTTDEVRPTRCAACGAAAYEAGRSLGIVGHGVRERQLRGPTTADATPTIHIVPVRRYLCRRCDAVMTVVPREVEPRRHYARSAIALALARLGLLHEAANTIRRATSPWRVVTTAGWRTLRRWIAAVRRGVLFASARPLASWTAIQVAERVAQIALAHASPSLRRAPTLMQVFAGAVAMA